MLPRQFLVKAILTALRRNPDIALEILSSRIADQVEIAAEVFESNDDPMPVPENKVREIFSSTAPRTPEDLGQHSEYEKRRSIADLPQPSLIVAPGSPEGVAAMSTGVVRPIRPLRAVADLKTGETPSWEFQELYAEVIGIAPETFEVVPKGLSAPITLDRTFQADPASGMVKLVYRIGGQKDSIPSTPGTQEAPITVPIEVSIPFSTYMPRSIDFAGAVTDLKVMAEKVFAPRAASITSTTPRTGGSLELMLSKAMRGQAGAPGLPDYTGGNGEDTESRTEVYQGPGDHWDPKFTHLRK